MLRAAEPLDLTLAVRAEDDATILAVDKPQSVPLPVFNGSRPHSGLTPYVESGRSLEPWFFVQAPMLDQTWYVVPLRMRDAAHAAAPHAARQLLVGWPRTEELKSQRFGDTWIEFLGGEGAATSQFEGLEKSAPDVGKTGWMRGNDGVTYLAYSPVSWEDPAYQAIVRLKTQVLAAIPEQVVRAPARRLQRQALAGMALFFLVALGIAALLSGRFLRVTEQLKSGIQAIGRGEPVALQRLSEDELGGGLVDTIHGMARDLAERGRREEFDNWTRVIRVLSHEINNTIAPVRSVAATLRERLRPEKSGAQDGGRDEELRDATALIAERMDALGKFVGRFGELARLPAPEMQEIDLSRLVTSAARMLTEEARERSVTIEMEGSGVRAQVDPGQMERVVINLVKNAVEASQAGQRVVVRTSRTAEGARVEVEDSGIGISAEARKNLFVPSFSTKPGGSGIGLALARQIVVGHRGTLTAEDRSGGGALFRVVVP